jgi:hypothetical protein
MLTEKDFYDYFAEETISIGFVSTQKPEEPAVDYLNYWLRPSMIEERGFDHLS